jgi:hypothetical protein
MYRRRFVIAGVVAIDRGLEGERRVVMRVPRSLGLSLAALVVVAACGGGSPATQAPGGATQGPGGGGATLDPGGGGGATTDPGGGGGSGSGTGKVTYQVTGSVERSGELPFLAFGSRFGGAAGVALNFTTEAGPAIFSIGEVSGAQTVALVDDEYGLSFANCEVFELNIDGENATGRFECSQGFGTKVSDGSIVSGMKISGTFDAHA